MGKYVRYTHGSKLTILENARSCSRIIYVGVISRLSIKPERNVR